MSIAFTANANWKDAATNIAASKTPVTLTDNANPVMVSSATMEVNGTYRAQVIFSETLSGSQLPGMSLSGSSTYTGAVTLISPRIYQLITGDSTSTDTSRTFALSYASSGGLVDPSGNPLAAITARSVTDGVPPKILSKTTADTNKDGKIDAISVIFSENLNASLGGLSAIIGGYTASGVTASGATVNIGVVPLSLPDSSATPAVQLTNTTL